MTGDTLTLTPDAGLLTDRNARYPLYIDPKWTPPNCVCTRDHYLVQYACGSAKTPGDTKWDNEDDLRAGFVVDPTSGCAGHQVTARSFVQLSLAGLAGKQIYGAGLNLSLIAGTSCSGANKIVLANAINGPVPFGNQPGWLSDIATVTACRGGGLGYDIKNLINDLTHNGFHPTFTFGLVSPNENDQDTWKRYSRDVGFSVTYNSVPNAPRNLQLWNGTQPFPCVMGPDRPAVGPSSTPLTMRANVSDPDGGMLYAGFRIYDSPGVQPVVWDGNETGMDNILSDSDPTHLNAQVSVPSNKMNKDGQVYSFDVHASDGQEDAWVSPCELELDLTAPNKPRVFSQAYPEDTY
ncbi:hypothetical protein ACFQ1S_26345, partial [Kibdelosporangium lantanae]